MSLEGLNPKAKLRKDLEDATKPGIDKSQAKRGLVTALATYEASIRRPSAQEVTPTDSAGEERSESVETPKRYLMTLPGEIPEASDGGLHVVDSGANPEAPGVFKREGVLFRPVTPEELTRHGEIMKDPVLKNEYGAVRMPKLLQRIAAEKAATNEQPANQEDAPSPREPVPSTSDAGTDSDQSESSSAPPLEPTPATPTNPAGDGGVEDSPPPEPVPAAGAGGAGGDGPQPPEAEPPEPTLRPTPQPSLDPSILVQPRAQQMPQGPDNTGANSIFAGIPTGPMQSPYTIIPQNYIGVEIKKTQDILHNESDSQFFGEILSRINPHGAEAILRYKNGQPTKDDTDMIVFATHEYSKWMGEAEKIAKKITPQDVELFARRNSDMRNLVTQVSDERGVEIIKNRIRHYAMNNQAGFRQMATSFKSLGERRDTGRYKRWDEKVNAQCEQLGIKPRDYEAIFDLSDAGREATHVRLAEHIHDRAGKFRKAIDWIEQIKHVPRIPGSSLSKAVWERRRADRITPQKSALSPRSWVLDTVKENLNDITGHLSSTVATDEMRSILAEEVRTKQKLAPSIEQGPKSFAAVQTLEGRNEFTEGGLERKMRARTAEPDWAGKSVPEQDRIISDMARETEREAIGGGGGFFAWLFSIILGKRMQSAADKAVGRKVEIM